MAERQLPMQSPTPFPPFPMSPFFINNPLSFLPTWAPYSVRYRSRALCSERGHRHSCTRRHRHRKRRSLVLHQTDTHRRPAPTDTDPRQPRGLPFSQYILGRYHCLTTRPLRRRQPAFLSPISQDGGVCRRPPWSGMTMQIRSRPFPPEKSASMWRFFETPFGLSILATALTDIMAGSDTYNTHSKNERI
jgi:hypothetical protein